MLFASQCQLFRDLLKANGPSISGRHLDEVKPAISWLAVSQAE